MVIKSKAFSLIELLVVIAIVGALAAIAVPTYRNYSSKVLITSAIQVLDTIKSKSLTYYNQNGSWPTTLANLNIATTDSLDTGIITAFGICAAPNGCFGASDVNGDYAGDYGFFVRLDPSDLALPATATNPTLIYSVEFVDGQMTWYCTTDSFTFSPAQNIAESFLPSGCISPD